MKTRDRLMLVVTTCLASPSWASETVRFEVAQPLLSTRSQDCLEVGHVSYVRNVGMARSGELVALTCAYSAVGRFAESTPFGSTQPAMEENQNAAALAGIEVRVRDIPHEQRTPMPEATLRAGAPWIRPGSRASRFVDTLDVELDMTAHERTLPHRDSLATRYRQKRATPDAPTACVVDCILDNAAREKIPIRFVRLRVIGAPTLRGFSKTYPVARPPAREYCEFAMSE